MKPFYDHNASSEDLAALWAAKLDGSTLTTAERQALDRWLAADPQHRALLSAYCQMSADLEQKLPALVAEGGIDLPVREKISRERGIRARWIAVTLAAAAAIMVTFSVLRPGSHSDTIATSVAQRKSIKLDDGSVVELNARTSLLVDFRSDQRHVRLADGEAFFTVARDVSRPFVVETPAGSVRVTGTVFDVHADTATDLAVIVVEGSVLVTPGRGADGRSAAPIALTANDHLVVNATLPPSVRRLNESELDDTPAWRRGEAVFVGTPLSEALARFARYHGRTIHTAPNVAANPVGGRFQLDDLDAFLSALEAFLPVRVTRDQSSGAISVSSRTGA